MGRNYEKNDYFFNNIFFIFVFVLIIAIAGFQPEIRRALQLAFYTNEANFKNAVAQGRNGISTEFNELADRLAAEFTVTASKNLRQSRLHHQLAKFEYIDTLRQLSEMMDLNLDHIRG